MICLAKLQVQRTPWHDEWVHVTTVWRVLWLRMEEQSPVWAGSCEYIE